MAQAINLPHSAFRKVGHYTNPIYNTKIRGILVEIELFDTVGSLHYFRVRNALTQAPIVPAVVGDSFLDVKNYVSDNWERYQ